MVLQQKKYDVVVIGGGPAGMIAAGRAAELGAKVVVLEKNEKLGKKLLITGGGRCNITNAEFEVKKMVAKYGVKGKALYGSFSRFGVEDTLSFFKEKGLPTKVEAEKRAFPVSNKAADVWKTLLNYMKDGGVEVVYNAEVLGIDFVADKISGVRSKAGNFIGSNYIVATGGKSRPETGSTGEGFQWMKNLGHSVEEEGSALVPMKIKESWVKNLSGLSFTSVKLTVFQDGKKQDSAEGKLLFTHFGISGPLALNMSKGVAQIFKYGPVDLFLDIAPSMDLSVLDKKVLEILSKYLNKMIKNSLGEFIPPKLIPLVLEKTQVDGEKEVNLLSRDERLKILKFIKAMPMSVDGFLGVEKAIVTSGGVSLKEIDFKNMQSKLFPNLFLAGDLLNFDRPSGGYSLQICWTTGYLAGENASGRVSP